MNHYCISSNRSLSIFETHFVLGEKLEVKKEEKHVLSVRKSHEYVSLLQIRRNFTVTVTLTIPTSNIEGKI